FIAIPTGQHREKKSPAMPGSPVDAKTHSRSAPSSSASSTMPPLPSVNPSGPRPASFSTTALTNGNHHSPPTLNAVPSPPQRYSNGPSSSSSSSLANQQLPATCGARQLSKLKRFLTTLQQFGNDISPEIGDSVRSLVLALVNSTVTIEEFHSRLQEATNFPLRPFVIPFLKVNTSSTSSSSSYICFALFRWITSLFLCSSGIFLPLSQLSCKPYTLW
uniref:CBFA2/RUNX1 partner transcriptional co-repressor 2 n=1 Tax=Dicentrarchus labrax TaxID=13489 RepID=A0A8C4F2Z4_DICLA